MQNTFVARLLAKLAPTPEGGAPDAPTADADAIEELTIRTPDVHPRPRLGSFARPMPVSSARMPMDCLWATCDGLLAGQGHNLHLCSNCETWFELLPPEGVLSEGMLDILSEHKAELLELLAQPEPEPQVETETCPICRGPLCYKHGKQFLHVWCPSGGYDSWHAMNGLKLRETDAPIVRGKED